MWSFPARKPLTCFYCLTPTTSNSSTSAALNAYYWRCPACEQWNRRDANGEIVPEPGAQNVFMNHESWQKRASLPDNAFPPGTPWSPFCTQCVTNQKLIVEMLANYIPDESDPTHPSALANIAAYRRDLERRYPPLCEECRPRVEAELRKHNDEATAEIRASAVAASVAGVASGSGVGTPRKDKAREGRALGRWETRIWRTRGFVWVLALVLSVARCVRVLVHPSEIPHGDSATREVIVTLASITWTTWNPKYLRYRRYLQAGVPTQTTGMRTWTSFQLLIYLFRLLLSVSYLGILSRHLPPTEESYRILGALSLTADTLLSSIAYRTMSIQKIPVSTKRSLVPLGPAPSRQTFYENALDGLRLSDSPQHQQTPTRQRVPSCAQTISPRFAASPPNSQQRASSLPASAAPSSQSPKRIPPTPPPGPYIAAEDSSTPMDVDPPPPSSSFYSTDLKPQTFPPRFTATGLEDLLSSWNLSDPAPPPAHPTKGGAGVGGGWQEVGLLELVEGVALCVGWASGVVMTMQVAWACVAVVVIYRLGQRQTVDSAVAAGAALLRAALPLPLLAARIGVSARVEALLWDAACLGVIVAARAFSPRT